MALQEGASTATSVKEAREGPLKAVTRSLWLRRRRPMESKSTAPPSEAAVTVATEAPPAAASEAASEPTGKAAEATKAAEEATVATEEATLSAAKAEAAVPENAPLPSGEDGAPAPSAAAETKGDDRVAVEGKNASGGKGSKNSAKEPIPLPPNQPKSKRRAAMWRAALFAVLLAMLTVGSRRLMLFAGPLSRGPSLTSNPKEVQVYEKALMNTVGDLKRLWDRVSPEVRQSFHTQYTPRVYGSSSLTAPMELFERQVMRLFKSSSPPSGSTPEAYGAYVQQLQIARVILKVAWTRMSQLQALEEFVIARRSKEDDRFSFRFPLLPGASMGSADEELVSFRDFLDLLGAKKAAAAAPIYPDPTSRKETVPLSLAEGLAKMLQQMEFQAEMDAKVHRAFHELLLVAGTPLPCGPVQPLDEFAKEGPLYVEPQRPFFPAPFFSSLLAAFNRERNASIVSDEEISTWAYQWTYEGAAQRFSELGERIHSRAAAIAAVKLSLVSRWALQQPHNPAATTDLTCLAFSLL